jgi:acyl-CoA thioester hydrolase
MNLSPHSFYLVRFTDCDPFGHLNNSRYLDYFLNAREDHLKSAYDMDLNHFYQQGLGWVVGGHEIKYLKPALYNEKICIRSTLLDVSENHLTVEMLMSNEKETHFKAILWTNFIPVDIKTGKKRSHSPEFMQFLDSVWNKTADLGQDLKTRLAILQSRLVKA